MALACLFHGQRSCRQIEHLCHRSSCAPGVPHRSPARLWPDPARALLPAGLGRAPSHLSGLSVPCPLPSPQAGTLTCELKDCPYCASALDDPDLEFSDSESGGSEGNAVYEFTQDVRHGDRRDPLRAPPAADAPGQGGTRPRAQRRAAPGEQGGLGHAWAAFSGKLCRIVDSKYFNRGIMVAILTNTLSMGVEYHEQVREGLGWPSCPPGEPVLLWDPAEGLRGGGGRAGVGAGVLGRRRFLSIA